MTTDADSLDLWQFAEQESRKALAAAAHKACNLPAEVQAILRVLESRRGRVCAITAAAIARAVGLQDGTKVRQYLELHFADLPWPVVADAAGYYRPADADDSAHYARNLRSRALCILRRLYGHARLAPLEHPAADVPAPAAVDQVIRHLEAVGPRA